MRYRELIESLARELPFPGVDGPERALEAVLTALFEAVPERTARAVLEAIPGSPQGLPQVARAQPPETRAELAARVAALLGESESRAIEQAEVVCAVLGRMLYGDERMRLLRALPDELRSLFESSLPHYSAAETGHRQTLADGAPGSTHPVSESRPGSRHPLSAAMPRRGQEHSMAEDNPHGDTKISSAPGLTQEREHESLSEGRSKRP